MFRRWLGGLNPKQTRKQRLSPMSRRKALLESLEPRLLLTDVGDTIGAAQFVNLTPGVQTEVSQTIGDGTQGNKDVDMYGVSLATGQTVHIDIDAEILDDNTNLSGLNSYVRLFNSMGSQLARAYFKSHFAS